MNRTRNTNKIIEYAARFVLEVEGFNNLNQYDINIHAEGFLIPIFNEVFNLQLENLNTSQKKNYPAIDLADFKNRVAFQVTATSDIEKIKYTLKKFKENQLHNSFDVLYIYIITHKKTNYNEKKLQEFIPENFIFSTKDNIIDKDDLIKKITSISSSAQLEKIAKLYEHEFSDIQLEIRSKAFRNGCLSSESETINPNLLRLKFPKYFYQAELNIDEEKITNNVNEILFARGKKTIKKLKPGTLVKNALKAFKIKSNEWVLNKKYIYTFRNLDDSNESFRTIIDIGTITKIECKDYYNQNDDNLKVFKHLLRNIMIELCKLKEIEWYSNQEVFRFANNQIVPNKKKIRWKGKNEATKTVIFEIQNKKEGHIICFRSLAFKCSFLNIDNDWYLVLNPTWSFTNPGGYNTSRYESVYMAGIKRLENNNSIYNYFRFFEYFLSHKDLFTTPYPFLEIISMEKLIISPKLVEKAWKPVKLTEKNSVDNDIDIQIDNELNDNTLFEL